eukprot:3125526-Rhodomonas_salina.1
MADAQVKKALKDLSLPLKPSATKAALAVADKVRKAGTAAQQNDARKMLGTRYEEKALVWEGGVIPLLVALLPLCKEKPMIEAVSLALSLAITDYEPNIALAAEAGVEKSLVELCKNASFLVQQHAVTAITQLCVHGTAASRAKILAAGGLKALTTIVKEVDTDDVIQKQGPPNKLIPYKPGQRQEEAIAAICAIACEAKTKKTAAEVGTLKQLVRTAECTIFFCLFPAHAHSLRMREAECVPANPTLIAQCFLARRSSLPQTKTPHRASRKRQQAASLPPSLLLICGVEG